MATNTLSYDATGIAAVNAIASLANSGFLNIYTGGQPALNAGVTGTLLVQLTFGATAFGSAVASSGTITATANAITSGTASNTGQAGYYALMKSDGVTVILTGTCGTSGANLNLSTLSIVSGAVVTCSSYTLTQTQTA